MSHYVRRRKQRHAREAADRCLAQTLRKNAELRYNLAALRSDGWRLKTPVWTSRFHADGLFPIPQADDGTTRLSVERIGYTVDLGSWAIGWAKYSEADRKRLYDRNVAISIAEHLIKHEAIQRYSSFQEGEYGHHRVMWSAWVGVKPGSIK